MVKETKSDMSGLGLEFISSKLSDLNFRINSSSKNAAQEHTIIAESTGGYVYKISVKTVQVDKIKDFKLSARDERLQSENFYYAFVNLKNPIQESDFWIIPSKIVCPLIKNAHNLWADRTTGNSANQASMIRLLPITVPNGQRQYYPASWQNEVKQYYKNLEQFI